MTEKLFLNFDLDRDVMAEVALMSNIWQLVEHTIDTVIWGLLRVSSKKGIATTAHMTFPLKCDVLRGLYHAEFKDENVDKQLSKLIKNVLKPAKKKRDKYAHALWLTNKKGQTTFLEKPSRTKPELTPKIVTRKNLENEMTSLFKAMSFFVFFIKGQLDYRVVPPELYESLLGRFGKQDSLNESYLTELPRRPTKPKKPLSPPQPVPA